MRRFEDLWIPMKAAALRVLVMAREVNVEAAAGFQCSPPGQVQQDHPYGLNYNIVTITFTRYFRLTLS